MLVSIIIPVYNVEKYIRRCLDSVLAQTFKDYECILVDDGSPDNCPAICDAYVEKDKRFKVIHKQKNEGLPRARKTGLDAATAEFIMHLDSDDWIEPEALELLTKKQIETDADIVMGGIQDRFPWGVRSYRHPKIDCNTSCLVYFFLNRCRNLCAKLYRKALFNDYIVPINMIGEDVVVNTQVFLKVNTGKLQIIDEIIYNYDHCTDGVTTQIRKQYNYNSYKESPEISCRLWVESFLTEKNQDRNVMAAFIYYLVSEGLILYLRYNKKITRTEIALFYTHYYKGCPYIKNISLHNRIIIPLFYRSMFFGKVYRLFMNRLVDICKYVLQLTRLKKI
jgi:glycosyltransferase involved in cell wall biosynthesis